MTVSPRQLAYKDRFVWLLEQVVSPIFDDCTGLTDPYIFPDLTTRIPFVMLLSQQEFTQLYSAVLTGADLSYPNTSHDIEYLFLQMVNCPMNELCAALIDCIQNDPLVMEAIISALSDSGTLSPTGDPETPLADDILGENLLPVGYACTNDKVFGMALAIADSINQAVTETLEAIEIATNIVELAAELGDNVPGAALLFSAADVANWVQDTAKEEYDLAWSTVIRDEIACDIYCLILDGCSITFDELHDYYLAQSLVVPPVVDTLEAWLQWLMAIVFGDFKSTVATISMLGLMAMRFGGAFGPFQLGIHSLETIIKLAEDDTDSGWSILCDPCITTWCYIFDFSIAAYWTSGGRDAPAPNIWDANYNDPVWEVDKSAGVFMPGDQAYAFHIPVPIGTVLTEISVEDEVTGTETSPGWSLTDRLIGSETNVVIQADGPAGQLHAKETRVYPLSYTMVNDSIMIQSGGGPLTPLVTTIQTFKVIIKGSGTDPLLGGVAC